RRAVPRRGAIQRTPHLRPRRIPVDDDSHHLPQVGEWLVHRYALHALDAKPLTQVLREERLERYALDEARLAWRDLRDDRSEDRVLAPRDAGDLHERVVLLQVHVAVRLAEGRFGLEVLGVDPSLDDDFRFR